MIGHDQDGAPIDREYLLSIADGDEEFIAELAHSYMQSSVNVISELREAVEQGDAYRIEQAAHALKGSSRAIGGNAAGAAFEVLELAGRSGQLAHVQDQLHEANDRYHALMSYMQAAWPVTEVIS